MDLKSIEFWALVISVVTLAISSYKTWKTNIQEFQKLADRVLTNEKNIKKHSEDIRLEMETVKRDRADRVAAMYKEIEDLKKLHKEDVLNLHDLFEKTMDKIQAQNQTDHKEITGKLDVMSRELTGICATFAEYRKHRNNKTPKEET